MDSLFGYLRPKDRAGEKTWDWCFVFSFFFYKRSKFLSPFLTFIQDLKLCSFFIWQKFCTIRFKYLLAFSSSKKTKKKKKEERCCFSTGFLMFKGGFCCGLQTAHQPKLVFARRSFSSPALWDHSSSWQQRVSDRVLSSNRNFSIGFKTFKYSLCQATNNNSL